MRWALALLLVACREEAPATTRRASDTPVPAVVPARAPAPPPVPAPLPPLEPTLRIAIEPGYPAPTKVMLRTEEGGATWQELALTGRVYLAPRPTTTFSIAIICRGAAHVLQLGPDDRYPLRTPCPLIDGQSGNVSLTSDRPMSYIGLHGPYGIGSLTEEHPEDTIAVPAKGVWDILAIDNTGDSEDQQQIAIARGLLAGERAAYRLTSWHRLERARIVVHNAPTTGTWSLASILRTSNGTHGTLQSFKQHPGIAGQPAPTLDVLVAPPAALVPGDCMQIFVYACAGSWCSATSSCTLELALHESPTAPITRVPGPRVVMDVGGFHDADIVNAHSAGFRGDSASEVFVTATRAFLAAHAPDGRLTIPLIPGFADATNDKARYLWLSLVWGLAPTTALPFEGGAWQRASTSIDFTGGPPPP